MRKGTLSGGGMDVHGKPKRDLRRKRMEFISDRDANSIHL